MASGDFRFLYDEILEYDKDDVWKDVFKAQWKKLSTFKKYYQTLRKKCLDISSITDEESWDLYSASRISDIMLLRFQQGEIDLYNGPAITLDNYLDFFDCIGFEEVKITEFHPFYCEPIEVINEDIDEIKISEVKWPALKLGNMLFSRGGVVVKAPENLLKRGVADNSCLYWTFRRKYRPTCDQSHGWGGNSQWSTNFRRDFDLSDRYIYNYDAKEMGNTKYASPELDMEGLKKHEVNDFIRYRCLTTTAVPDRDLYPYNFYYEEMKRKF